MSETQAMDMAGFAKNELAELKTTATGQKIPLKEKLGDKYNQYEELVLEAMTDIDTPYNKRLKEQEFGQSFAERVREANIPGIRLVMVRSRAHRVYKAWLEYKHAQQATEQIGAMGTKRGTQPDIYLKDNSGRKSLGYISSPVKET